MGVKSGGNKWSNGFRDYLVQNVDFRSKKPKILSVHEIRNVSE